MGLLSKILSGLGLELNLPENYKPTQTNSTNSPIQFTQKDYKVITEVVSKYLEVSRDYQKFYKEIERVRETYIAEVILDQFTFDTLTPDVSSDNIIEITPNIDNPELAKALEDFQLRFDIDRLVQDITPDLIAFGSYTLKPIIEEGQGIVEIKDDYLPYEVIPFYKGTDLEFYLKLDDKGKPNFYYNPTDFVVFFVNARRIRLRLGKGFLSYFSEEERKKLPSFLKIGTPLFTSGVIKKIKELDLLEKLVPASQIQLLSKGNVVGVYVSPTMSPEEASDFAKQLERKLNSLGVSVDKDLDQLSIVEILKGAGRIKVIPVTSEKGQITKLDYKPEESSNLLDSIQDLRQVILTSVGIPPELVFNSGDSTKNEILKRYSRYYRKLKYIQKAIVDGLRELTLIHLINKGISVTPEDFSIRFTNSIINIDDLDKIEYAVTITQNLSDIHRFVNDLQSDENLSQYVNTEGFAEYLNNELSKIGLDSLIQLPGEEQDYEANPTT